MKFRAGGGLGALVTSPLEVMKTRLQATRHKKTLRKDFMFGLGTIRGIWYDIICHEF